MLIRLETSIKALDDLHARITARAKAVSVPIETLNGLLIDHHRMARALEALGAKLADVRESAAARKQG